jgi:hypothetical protein
MVRIRARARAQNHPLPNEIRGRAQDAKNVYCFSLSSNTSIVDAKGDIFTHGSGDCRVYRRTPDATILFDSFTQIYLVICLCFIYIMH